MYVKLDINASLAQFQAEKDTKQELPTSDT